MSEDKIGTIYQIFLGAGFTDVELSNGGILEELLNTSYGLAEAYPPVWAVKLSIDEARGLLDRLERSTANTAWKENDDANNR